MVHPLLKEGNFTVGEDYNGVWSCNGLVSDRRFGGRLGTICFNTILLTIQHTTVMGVRLHLLLHPLLD